jgi:hypothetical protein
MKLYGVKVNSSQTAIVRATTKKQVVELLQEKRFETDEDEVFIIEEYNTLKKELVVII